jgi:hypothetical protein
VFICNPITEMDMNNDRNRSQGSDNSQGSQASQGNQKRAGQSGHPSGMTRTGPMGDPTGAPMGNDQDAHNELDSQGGQGQSQQSQRADAQQAFQSGRPDASGSMGQSKRQQPGQQAGQSSGSDKDRGNASSSKGSERSR